MVGFNTLHICLLKRCKSVVVVVVPLWLNIALVEVCVNALDWWPNGSVKNQSLWMMLIFRQTHCVQDWAFFRLIGGRRIWGTWTHMHTHTHTDIYKLRPGSVRCLFSGIFFTGISVLASSELGWQEADDKQGAWVSWVQIEVKRWLNNLSVSVIICLGVWVYNVCGW